MDLLSLSPFFLCGGKNNRKWWKCRQCVLIVRWWKPARVVNRTTCSCDCWDAVFKGTHDYDYWLLTVCLSVPVSLCVIIFSWTKFPIFLPKTVCTRFSRRWAWNFVSDSITPSVITSANDRGGCQTRRLFFCLMFCRQECTKRVGDLAVIFRKS